MTCSKCDKNIEKETKYCSHCGAKNEDITKADLGSVDEYFQKKEKGCKNCGVVADKRYIKFYKNIGMIIQREYGSIEGEFCKKCIKKYFIEYTLVTFLLGWWGTISFFVTPFYLMNNIFRYITTLNLKES